MSTETGQQVPQKPVICLITQSGPLPGFGAKGPWRAAKCRDMDGQELSAYFKDAAKQEGQQ